MSDIIENVSKEDLFLMDIAILSSNRSYAVRKKVGASIRTINGAIFVGYNGTPTGWDNQCEEDVNNILTTKPEVIHGEMNAIFKALASGSSLKNSVLCVTLSPCLDCAKALYLAGVDKVFYVEEYRNTAGLEFLHKSGIICKKVKHKNT